MNTKLIATFVSIILASGLANSVSAQTPPTPAGIAAALAVDLGLEVAGSLISDAITSGSSTNDGRDGSKTGVEYVSQSVSIDQSMDLGRDSTTTLNQLKLSGASVGVLYADQSIDMTSLRTGSNAMLAINHIDASNSRGGAKIYRQSFKAGRVTLRDGARVIANRIKH